MWDFPKELRNDLKSSHPMKVGDALRKLRTCDEPLSPAAQSLVLNALTRVDLASFNEAVFREVVRALLLTIGRAAFRPVTLATRVPWALDVPGSVLHWLLEPIRARPSQLLTLDSDSGTTHDELALADFRSMVGRKEFPHLSVTTWPVPEHKSHAEAVHNLLKQITQGKLAAVLFLGRLQSFGEEVVAEFDNHDLRFVATTTPRPLGLPRREINEEYHRGFEVVPGRSRATLQARRTPDRKLRIDYGFIQRYVAQKGGHPLTVYRIWGLSSLGTEGAAEWFATKLPQLLAGDSRKLLMVPGGGKFSTASSKRAKRLRQQPLDPNAPFEAVIEVQAKETLGSWCPHKLKLLALYVGPYAWDQENGNWLLGNPREVRLVYAGRRLVKILLDGRQTKLTPQNVNGKLLAAAVEAAIQSQKLEFDAATLRDRQELWPEGKVVGGTDIGNNLSMLKLRHVHTLEFPSAGLARFRCDLVIERDGREQVYRGTNVLELSEAPVVDSEETGTAAQMAIPAGVPSDPQVAATTPKRRPKGHAAKHPAPEVSPQAAPPDVPGDPDSPPADGKPKPR